MDWSTTERPVAMPIPDALRTEIHAHLDNLPHGWCRPEKACRLAEIIIDNGLERIIEIGIFGGRSIVPMALAVRHQQRGCVFGLDPWDIQHALEGEIDQAQREWWAKVDLEAIRESFEGHANKHRLWEWLKWMRIGGVEMSALWRDGWADMIHLDADHSEVTSCRDVQLWMPKLRPGGYFIFDDCNWPSQQKAGQILGHSMQYVETHAYEDGQAFAVYRKCYASDPMTIGISEEVAV